MEEGSEIEMSFYDDGSCIDVPFHGPTSADVESYKMQNDGTIILVMEWDGNMTLKPTDNQEEALKNRSLYYLSGNTLVMHEDIYHRK